MQALTGNSSFAESLAIERKVKYNFWKEEISSRKEKKDSNVDSRNKIVSASDLFDSDEEIAEK
jgi:predicted lipase